VVEIQTSQFARLLPKLRFFLERYPVTVVHPMPRTRYITWTDPETGESSKPRKSPVVATPLTAFHQLYQIRSLLGVENLTVELLLFDIDEYRLLDGYGKFRKKGATLTERIPRGEPELIRLQTPADYDALLPENLPMEFTVPQLSRLLGLRGRAAYSVIHVLEELGIARECGSCGRATLYRLT
jgi:hypothetical protein